MPREMRRHKQQLSREDCLAILDRGTSGVLALLGQDGYPYAVPLSYVRVEDKLYFHSANQGHKLDAIAHWGKTSFCVIDQDQVVPQEFTSYFRSVIAFGRVRVLGEGEVRAAIEALADKYSPGEPGREVEIQKFFPQLAMIELAMEHISGKEAIELVRERS